MEDEKLAYIREKCIEVNPEIVELKFGCKGTFVHPSSGVTIHCTVIEAYPWTGIRMNYENCVVMIGKTALKPIGRPIRLADVLLTLQEKQQDYVPDATISNLSQGYWNLRDDDLSHQPEETIEYVYNLLQKTI